MYHVPVQNISTGLPSVITCVKTRETLNNCHIQPSPYKTLLQEIGNANLLVFTDTPVEQQHHLHSRVFIFTSGHLKDPATGSAHGNLASYLLHHQFYQKNHLSYRAEQGYAPGRNSLLHVNASLAEQQYTIQVGGRIEVTAEGSWY